MRHGYFNRDFPDGLAYGVDSVGNRAAEFGQQCGIPVQGASTRIAGNPEPELNEMLGRARSRPAFDPALHDGNLWTTTGNHSGPVG